MSGTINVGLATLAGNTIGGVEKSRSYWDVGGRFGVLITPQILSYWTGGYTQSRFDGITLTTTGIGGGPVVPMSVAANTYHGWFTGGGVETQVTSIPGLFFNTEYRYASYTSATLPISGAAAAGALGFAANLKFQPHEQTVMSGVRYKFNWPQ
jgi:outer membrane immunogenic protein